MKSTGYFVVLAIQQFILVLAVTPWGTFTAKIDFASTFYCYYRGSGWFPFTEAIEINLVKPSIVNTSDILIWERLRDCRGECETQCYIDKNPQIKVSEFTEPRLDKTDVFYKLAHDCFKLFHRSLKMEISHSSQHYCMAQEMPGELSNQLRGMFYRLRLIAIRKNPLFVTDKADVFWYIPLAINQDCFLNRTTKLGCYNISDDLSNPPLKFTEDCKAVTSEKCCIDSKPIEIFYFSRAETLLSYNEPKI